MTLYNLTFAVAKTTIIIPERNFHRYCVVPKVIYGLFSSILKINNFNSAVKLIRMQKKNNLNSDLVFDERLNKTSHLIFS
jgi:hypothetical protein